MFGNISKGIGEAVSDAAANPELIEALQRFASEAEDTVGHVMEALPDVILSEEDLAAAAERHDDGALLPGVSEALGEIRVEAIGSAIGHAVSGTVLEGEPAAPTDGSADAQGGRAAPASVDVSTTTDPRDSGSSATSTSTPIAEPDEAPHTSEEAEAEELEAEEADDEATEVTAESTQDDTTTADATTDDAGE